MKKIWTILVSVLLTGMAYGADFEAVPPEVSMSFVQSGCRIRLKRRAYLAPGGSGAASSQAALLNCAKDGNGHKLDCYFFSDLINRYAQNLTLAEDETLEVTRVSRVRVLTGKTNLDSGNIPSVVFGCEKPLSGTPACSVLEAELERSGGEKVYLQSFVVFRNIHLTSPVSFFSTSSYPLAVLGKNPFFQLECPAP
jgi:hypothetical protein